MRIFILLVSCFLTSCFGTQGDYLQEKQIQLSKPIIAIEKVFFQVETEVQIGSTDPKATIQVTSTDFQKSRIYRKPLILTKSSILEAKAVSKNYEDSEVVKLEVVKLPLNKVESVITYRSPSLKYAKGGNDILIDHIKGGANFRDNWLGYEGDSISYLVEFGDEKSIDKIVVSTLRNQDAWIFEPAKIRVMLINKVLAEVILSNCTDKRVNSNIFTEIVFPKIESSQLTVEVVSAKQIPEWHPGKGNKPWLFIDEILIY